MSSWTGTASVEPSTPLLVALCTDSCVTLMATLLLCRSREERGPSDLLHRTTATFCSAAVR